MDMREKLKMLKQEESRWEKTTYRTYKSDPTKKKAVRQKRSVIYLDPSILRQMMKPLSNSATQIALLILDECEFGSNYFHSTYDEVRQVLDLSNGAVIKGMTDLLSVDFMRKVRNGKWMLNPTVGAKCYQEDVNKLMNMYFALNAYESKSKKGEKKNDIA